MTETVVSEVLSEVRGQVGLITLNRPRALNALSLGMVRDLMAILLAWQNDARVLAVAIRGSNKEGPFGAFCAGGDIRFLHQAGSQGNPLIEDFFTEEYALNHLIHNYAKPYIAFMDGIVMGGGMGISQGAALRVVTERTKMAMPETAIGLFPDVGGGYFLSRCPGRVGEWLALTGDTAGWEAELAWRQGDAGQAERIARQWLADARPDHFLGYWEESTEAIGWRGVFHPVAWFAIPGLLWLGALFALREREVNWKNVSDNYSDSLHITVAHPGLTRLFGKSYGVEATDHVDRMWGDLIERPSVNWSERMYQRLLPPVPHLPQANQRHWLYFKLWPNVAFDIYPDQIDFMQWLPTGPTSCLIREISYVLPDDRREMRAARYLNWRINRQVNAEDTVLITRVQQGMASRSFSMGPLSDKEVCLRHFCRRIRDLIEQVFPDFKDFNTRVAAPGGFRLRNTASERVWTTASGVLRGTARPRQPPMSRSMPRSSTRASMKNSIMRCELSAVCPRSGPTCTSKLLPAACSAS